MRAFVCSTVWLSLLLGACSDPKSSAAASSASVDIEGKQARAALASYADIASASYQDAATGARGLLERVYALVAEPSEATLHAARESWLVSREAYAQTEAFRFCDGPIERFESLINAWPIDESVTDTIISDIATYPDLTRELLQAQNEREGETAITTGYHVVEYLLWGRDDNPDGPGARPYTDYAPINADSKAVTTEARRGRYLVLACELLVAHLEAVAQAWAPEGANSYRIHFLNQPTRESLRAALHGIGKLSGPELSGERLAVAYETKDQENEHSCFSDSTSADLAGAALGIANVCTGTYRKSDGSTFAGTGLCSLFGELGIRLRSQTQTSVTALRAIPRPFDKAILGRDDTPGRIAVKRAIDALQTQAGTLGEIAQVLALSQADGASIRAPER